MVSSRPRVLVVEDDPQLAALYCRCLAMHGIDSTTVRDGFSALRSIEQQPPGLILLDLNLPYVSGYTVLDDLAANPLTSGIPVVIVTGIDPKPLLPHAIVILCKPCDPDHVAKIVADHLPARRN